MASISVTLTGIKSTVFAYNSENILSAPRILPVCIIMIVDFIMVVLLLNWCGNFWNIFRWFPLACIIHKHPMWSLRKTRSTRKRVELQDSISLRSQLEFIPMHIIPHPLLALYTIPLLFIEDLWIIQSRADSSFAEPCFVPHFSYIQRLQAFTMPVFQ